MSRSPARFTQADVARALRAYEQVNGRAATIGFRPDGTMVIIGADDATIPIQAAADDLDAELEEWRRRHGQN